MSEPRFMSQHGEDRWIFENLKPAPGFFIEVGAFNGYNCSNTLAFEDLGWSGICVEPDPELAAECFKFRKAQTICAAVGNVWRYGHLAEFKVNTADRGTSGLTQQWDKSILVPVVPLLSLLAYADKGCDLLSIDTEGSELDVWDSGAAARYFPRIVIMEFQTRDLPSQETALASRMWTDGYKVAHKTEHNLIFVKQ